MSVSLKDKKKSLITSNIYSYSLIKDCAKAVLNRDYWDDSTGTNCKKWLCDARTSKLKFTNKWVVGILQRDAKKRRLLSFELSTTNFNETIDDNSYENNLSDIYNTLCSFSLDRCDQDLLNTRVDSLSSYYENQHLDDYFD